VPELPTIAAMRRKFLANPAAAAGSLGRRLPSLTESLKSRFGSADVEVGENWGDLRARAKRAADDGFEVVVALGGDGTVNAVGNGLYGSKTALAVGPLGTGCDYYRGYAGKLPWLEVLASGTPKAVDVVEIHSGSGRRVYLNMASAGLSADVVRRREGVPAAVPAILAYGIPALAAVFAMRGNRVHLEIDGETIDEDFVTVFLAKGTFAGGGMRIGANAKLDDGKIAFTAVRAEGTFRSLPRFPRLYDGRFDDPLFLVRSASHVKIHPKASWLVECDGELIGSSPIEARVLPGALSLLVPGSGFGV